jgi:hypothetical protein
MESSSAGFSELINGIAKLGFFYSEGHPLLEPKKASEPATFEKFLEQTLDKLLGLIYQATNLMGSRAATLLTVIAALQAT